MSDQERSFSILGPRITVSVFTEEGGGDEFEFYVLDALAFLFFFGSQIFSFYKLVRQII